MNRLASPAQLRASLLRWALFLIPLVMLLGFLSGRVGGDASSPWFMALEKPAIFPPPATFGIVWSALYFMMGLALAMIAAAWGARWRPYALIAFVIQLALNLVWSPVFFGLHDIKLAQVILVALVVAVVVTIWLFAKVRLAAAWLLVPYLAWIAFASVLNWQFMQLNPDAKGIDANNAVQRIEL